MSLISELTQQLRSEAEWQQSGGDDGLAKMLSGAADVIEELSAKLAAHNLSDGWVPQEEHPSDDRFVLLSFENFSIPLVGRYEKDADGGGSYYVGDEEDPLVSQGLFVNAWMDMPEPYKPESEPAKCHNCFGAANNDCRFCGDDGT